MAKKVQVVLMDSVLSRRTQFQKRLSQRFDVKVLTATTDLISTIKTERPEVVVFSLRQMSTHGLRLCSELRESLPKGDKTIVLVYGKKPRSLSQTRKELEDKFGVNAFIPFDIEYPQLEAALLSELEIRNRTQRKADNKKREVEALAAKANLQGEKAEPNSWKQLLKSDVNPSNIKAIFTKPILSRNRS